MFQSLKFVNEVSNFQKQTLRPLKIHITKHVFTLPKKALLTQDSVSTLAEFLMTTSSSARRSFISRALECTIIIFLSHIFSIGSRLVWCCSSHPFSSSTDITAIRTFKNVLPLCNYSKKKLKHLTFLAQKRKVQELKIVTSHSLARHK